MLIQNASNAAQSVRLTSDGAPVVVAAKQPGIAVESPFITPTPEQLKSAVDGINQAMQMSNSNLEFSVDPNTNKPIVQMVDTETGKLILQIPSKAALAIAQSIDQYQRGLLLNQKA